MLRNYLLVTFRTLRKNSFYSFINISGLAIGIACSILIILWVADETSFDKFHPKADRLYQVWVNIDFDGHTNSWVTLPLPTYEAMKTADANISNVALVDWSMQHLLTVSENKRLNKFGMYASEEFLEMFQFPLISGNAEQVLDDPSNIVISQSTAKALFGNDDAMGKTIRVDNQYDFKVAGILKDIPSNSSFQFDFIMPWKHRYQVSDWVASNINNWNSYSFRVFAELNDPKNKAGVEDHIRNMYVEHENPEMKPRVFLYPLLRWRLHSNFENGVEQGGMIEYVQLFSIIAGFIIVIACINFMNLATARSERRAKEVGIRKSIGSRRRELIFQFMGESLIIALISFAVAVIAAQLLLPSYNTLVDKKLFIDYSSKEFWIFSLGSIIFTGIIAGSYPAFYLSGFQPLKVLKGKPNVGKSATLPRKILVTTQFGFSIVLIISMFVIFNQIQLVKGRNVGYSKENLINVRYNDELRKNFRPLKAELLASNAVESVVRSISSVTNIESMNFVGWPGKPADQKVLFITVATDYDWSKTLGIRMIEGRDFSEDVKSDSNAIIVNKSAIKMMGLKDPIGTELDLWGHKRKLIGISDDVLIGSPYEEVKPMFVILDPGWVNNISIRLSKTQDLSAALNEVQKIFAKYAPAYPFEYTFVDQDFAQKFATIDLTSKLASMFALLAIVITGLGLFGLASFTAEQRTKEIGIRKILGASVSNLVTLISRDFSIMVIVAFAISAPLSWWLMTQYLERYTVRTNIAWWIFPLTGAIALAFALVIVSTQALRAANSNPVKSLRSE